MIGKRVRKYYRLTTKGAADARVRVADFIDFIKTMSTVLKVQLN
jgi:DNA-binding PadR family transcriptional regulator